MPRAGTTEETVAAPVGEYGWSLLGRERTFEHFSRTHGTKVALVRLNFAVETRYGILVDLAKRILAKEPVDLTAGHVNLIWQRDANEHALRCIRLAGSPPPRGQRGVATFSCYSIAGLQMARWQSSA